MKRYICALLLAAAGIATAVPQAMAQDAQNSPKKAAVKKPTAKKATTKKSTAKQASKKKAAAAAAATTSAQDEDDIVPDITGSTTVDYQCEMGNKLTIYENQTDSQHVALRWNKKLHRLKRVSTTTGASRFENKKYGLVWIGIPAKAILLDSKKGQQLANECKSARELAPAPLEVMTQTSTTPILAPTQEANPAAPTQEAVPAQAQEATPAASGQSTESENLESHAQPE